MSKRDKIFAAAINLFSENGFHGTPTSQIAKEAGVANGTLFHHFKSKEQLINELYLELKKELIEVSFSNLHSDNGLIDNLKLVWVSNIEWALTHTGKIIFLQQFINSPYLTQETKNEVDALALAYFQLMEQGTSLGLIKDIPYDFIYNQASQQLFGVINYLLNNQTNKDKIIDHAFQMFWDGIKK